MSSFRATPVLPGRAAHHGFARVLALLLVVALLGMVIASVAFEHGGWPSGFAQGLAWLLVLLAALVADARASALALAEARTAAPRAVNPWDVAAVVLALASALLAPVPRLVRAEHPATLAQTLAMGLLSAWTLVWFLARARRRRSLGPSERAWPFNDRGKPRTPVPVGGVFGWKSALAVTGIAVIAPGALEQGSFRFWLAFLVLLAASNAAETRRATAAWWERPTPAFGRDDLLAFVLGCLGLAFAVLAFVAGVWRDGWTDDAFYAALLGAVSFGSVVGGFRRWKRRHLEDDPLAVWD